MLWDLRKGRAEAAPSGAALADDSQAVPTKALKKFLGGLAGRDAPVLLDLGPVVGSNVTFLGERLGCKILIEDLFADLDRHARSGGQPLAELLPGRLKHAPSSIDGILCWNLFDYLDAASAQTLASSLVRLLRPDGFVLAFCATIAAADTRFMRYVIAGDEAIRQKPYSEGGKKQKAVPNRDMLRYFEGLKVSESFLLKTNVREFLFRKPV